jgi:thiol-disulfide isomerase/thioredoxin
MNMLTFASAVSIVSMCAASGCSSSGGAGAAAGTPQDPGLARNLPAVENRNTNSYGLSYPTSDIGTGINQRIKNFRFLGYPAGDNSALKTIALSDFYDPDQKHADGPIKLLHIQAAGYWCVYCQKEADELGPITDELRAKGVVWLTTVAEGKTSGVDSTLADLDKWFGKHLPKNPTVLDPGNANLGVFYKAAALPWNAWIDARSMEIISYEEGARPIKADVEETLRKWQSRTPKTAQ